MEHCQRGLISISEAADRLHLKPWDVVRLIESGSLRHVVLVDESSLTDRESL